MPPAVRDPKTSASGRAARLAAILTLLALPWLLAMGVGDSQGPTRIPEPRVNYRAALTDQTGTSVELTWFAIEGVDFLLGRVGQGEVAVPFKSISGLELRQADGQLRCKVGLKKGETVELVVKPALSVTGRTDFGNYRIPLGEVSRVELLGRAR